MTLEEMTVNEIRFVEEADLCKNEHGVYNYISQDGKSMLNMVLFLESYKEWLIEKKIVKPCN